MTILRIAVAAVAIVLTAAVGQAQTAALGAWDLTTISPEGEFKSVLEVRQEGDKIIAVGKSPQGERPYDSVAVEGSNITLVMTISYNGSPMTITYMGKIDGPKIEGSADYGGLATGTFSAAKK